MSMIAQEKYYRQRMVKYAQKHTVMDTALRYKTSRKTVYKWLSRYDGTIESLADRSHRPHRSPRSHSEDELKKIVRRLKKNSWNDLLLAYQELVEKDGYTRSYGSFKRIAGKLKAEKQAKKKAKKQA